MTNDLIVVRRAVVVMTGLPNAVKHEACDVGVVHWTALAVWTRLHETIRIGWVIPSWDPLQSRARSSLPLHLLVLLEPPSTPCPH